MKATGQRLWGVLLAAAVIIAVAWAFRPSPIPVDLAPVSRGAMLLTVDEDGITRIKDRYIVSSPLRGLLRRVDLEAGDEVQAGRTLLTVIEPSDPQLLDAREHAQAQARIKAAEANQERAARLLERARAAHELASKEWTRAQPLLQAGVLSQGEYDLAATNRRTTAEDLRAAEFGAQIAAFELELARAALPHTAPISAATEQANVEIRSPITGRVLRVLQESAAVVQAGTPLLELGDATQLEIVVDVLSSDGAKIRPGARMILERWGGDQPLGARVRLVEPAAFLKISALGVEEQRVNVIGDLLDPPEQRPTLGDAYRVEARIVIWEGNDVLKIPAGALFRRGGRWASFVADRSRARLVFPEIRHHNGQEAEVLSGLAAGDRVIMHPSDRLDEGGRIRPRS